MTYRINNSPNIIPASHSQSFIIRIIISTGTPVIFCVYRRNVLRKKRRGFIDLLPGQLPVYCIPARAIFCRVDDMRRDKKISGQPLNPAL